MLTNDQTETAIAAKLLHRTIPDGYRAQTTAQIAASAQHISRSSLFAMLVFRLGQEWLALPAAICQQVLSPVKSHSLPHRSNRTLIGVVNVRGQLLLKVSLFEILGLARSSEAGFSASNIDKTVPDQTAIASNSSQPAFRGYRRMVVVKRNSEEGQSETWAFEVDELHGVHSLSFDQLQPVAAGAIAASNGCAQYVFSWQNRQVSVLDDIKLFNALRLNAL